MTDIASHRGGALLWPENSRIAFENTAKLQVEQVEFDVHPTRDGKLVVIHDDTLDRTTDGKGPVAAQDWAAPCRSWCSRHRAASACCCSTR
jgi:glycerophosphoryl diester phosphodiesterase